MKLQLSETGCRFRIDPDEFERLLSGQSLHQRLETDRGVGLSYGIFPAQTAQAMRVEICDGAVRLLVSQRDLETLRNGPPCREGMTSVHDGLEISLQIDLKAAALRRAR